jgi:hypothetical protein
MKSFAHFATLHQLKHLLTKESSSLRICSRSNIAGDDLTFGVKSFIGATPEHFLCEVREHLTDEKFCSFCDPSPVKAMVYCPEWDDFLCSDCLKHYTSSKLSRHHLTISKQTEHMF